MKNKRALVCGSSKGIGSATAIELSKLGVSVILLARNEKSLSKVIKKLDTTQNQKHDYIIADFDNPPILKEKINNYLKKELPIQILNLKNLMPTEHCLLLMCRLIQKKR